MALATKYLVTNGATSASTPYHADYNITGDFEIRFDIAYDDVDVALHDVIFGRWDSNQAADRIWAAATRTNSNINTRVYRSGLSLKTIETAIGWADATRIQVRLEFDIDDGAGNHAVTRYNRSGANLADLSDNTNWTTLGTTNSAHGGNVTLQTSTATGLWVSGQEDDDTADLQGGKFYAAQFYNAIGGTLVANFNANDFSHGDTGGATAVDTVSRTWTLQGTGTIVDPNAGTGGNAGHDMLLLGVPL